MAIQQAAVTVTGFVAGDPTMGGVDGFPVLTFRMGSTRSRLNPNTKQWEDFATAWLTVKAFRALANNTKQSIRRGDRVIVVGLLNTEQWNTEQGDTRSRMVVEATNIGHDLTFGTTSLSKTVRNNGGAQSSHQPQQPLPSNEGSPDAGAGAYASGQPVGPVELGVTAESPAASDSSGAVSAGASSADAGADAGPSGQADSSGNADLAVSQANAVMNNQNPQADRRAHDDEYGAPPEGGAPEF